MKIAQNIKATILLTALALACGLEPARGQSSPLVDRWLDKSGNGRHLTQTTRAKMPEFVPDSINGQGIVRFTPNTVLCTAENITNVLANPAHTVFLVAGVATTEKAWLFGQYEGDTTNRYLASMEDRGGYRISYFLNGSDPARLLGTTEIQTERYYLLEFAKNGSTTMDLRVNTTQDAAGSTINPTVLQKQFTIGGTDSIPVYSSGDLRMAELIVVTNVPGGTDRLKIEGYLAHKWDLDSYLPDGHTYESAPEPGWSPADLTTLSLWLDAADAASVKTRAQNHTSGLSVWLDAQDMNGNGDRNASWSSGNEPSTNKHWVNKGNAGNPLAYGVSGGTNPVYRSGLTAPDGSSISAVEFDDTRNIRLPNGFLSNTTFTVVAVLCHTNNYTPVLNRRHIFLAYNESPAAARISLELLDNDGASLPNGRVRTGVWTTTTDALRAETPYSVVANGAFTNVIWRLKEEAGGYVAQAGTYGNLTPTTTIYGAPYTGTDWIGGDLRIGLSATGFAFDGWLAELLIYNYELPNDALDQVQLYLYEKYGIGPRPTPKGSLILLR